MASAVRLNAMHWTCWKVTHAHWASLLSAWKRSHWAVVAAGGMSGYMGGACRGGVNSLLLQWTKMAVSCRMPRCPSLCPHGHSAAIKLLPSSFSSFLIILCVGLPSTPVRVWCGISVSTDSQVTNTMTNAIVLIGTALWREIVVTPANNKIKQRMNISWSRCY